MSYHIYISNSGSDWLSHFIMDEGTGKLNPQPNVDLEGTPGAVAVNSDETLMFVCLRSAGKFASYSIDGSSGKLTPIDTSNVKEGPPYIYADNTDSYLLASYYGSGQISVHGIDDKGAISDEPLQTLSTDIRAHSIQTDSSNRFAFVPHTNPTNAIYQFKFDDATGTLTPNDPPRIQPETEEGPRHFIFHPSMDVLYSVNENGSTVSVHRFDSNAGTLESFQVISTLAAPVEGNTTAELDITPDGRFLYASNRGHDSLALFAVGDDGSLTAKARYDTEDTPRFFAIDPTASYVYSVGQGSGHLQSYSLDKASGALEPLERHKVGDSPLWITFVTQE